MKQKTGQCKFCRRQITSATNSMCYDCLVLRESVKKHLERIYGDYMDQAFVDDRMRCIIADIEEKKV